MTLDLYFWALNEADARRLGEQWAEAEPNVERFHSTRHTFASLALDAGADPLVLQQVMGHSKVTQTGHYARSGDALRRSVVDGLDGLIGQRIEEFG